MNRPSSTSLLAARRQATGMVFLDPATGRPWSETKPSQVYLNRAYAEAGLVHDRSTGVWRPLRHTFSSLLLAGGIPPAEVELLMGHKIPGTTGRYLHLMHATFPKVEAALDEVFGDYLRGRLAARKPAAAAEAKPETAARPQVDAVDRRFVEVRF